MGLRTILLVALAVVAASAGVAGSTRWQSGCRHAMDQMVSRRLFGTRGL